MDRRTFFLTSAASLGLTSTPILASPLTYTPNLHREHLNNGETVILFFKASWSGTCAAQEEVLETLKSQDPSYEQNITFIDIDWDTYGPSVMADRMKITRRSTLVVLKGKREITRLVADTSERNIKKLLDSALNAARNG
ncbi:thioredoxin family protein [Planktotalea sp.]|uniref:thioredoxin family protein n=1 Tax=Planktotalea sp. TaxID=2029877 RepID=UPI003299A9A5